VQELRNFVNGKSVSGWEGRTSNGFEDYTHMKHVMSYIGS
jgi:hypothetical protein